MSCVPIALLLGLVSVRNSGLTEEVIENVIQKSGQILSSAVRFAGRLLSDSTRDIPGSDSEYVVSCSLIGCFGISFYYHLTVILIKLAHSLGLG